TGRVRADEERPARAEGEDGDDRVVEIAHLAIAVRRDTVAAVAVVVEPGARERLAVPAAQREPRVLEHGMGHRLAVAVPVRQPGIVDVALVHEAPALAP